MKNIINKDFEPNFWKNEKLSEEKKNEMLVNVCRKVFATEEGKIVLNMLLQDLRVFKYSAVQNMNATEHALNEYGKFFIRERLGVRDIKAITDFIAETARAS